ncbi:LysR family transcriptional regulator [Marivibrio halodurans]|uniref:LysR family transcriptional regulator n=1 Tax=Marivibrio halodurans TaxID=2039722 RepID=A0A8J7RW87_9PROT|nr:LysR family transcriptional regulator [Marivibrio halodurans]MBP5855842.1 LysR family transcriptional regulator [Marivibrio halodurans]
MDRFDAMSMLLATVDHGSLSAAGRALHVPVPTLSRRISDLEERLGTKLLIRTTRSLALTDAGTAYVEAARRILEQVEAAEREATGEFVEPKGELVVTAPLLFGRRHVLPIVTDFLARFPAIDIRLVLSDRNVRLVEDHVDMAVRLGDLPDSAMVATRVGTMRTVLCASPGLIAAHDAPRGPEDLRHMPCVAFDAPIPLSSWSFHDPATKRRVDIGIRPRLSVSTADAAAQAAINGAGVTRLFHYQVADALAAGTLQLVMEDHEPPPTPVHLIHAARGAMPLKLRRFLDIAAPRLRRDLEMLPSSDPTMSRNDHRSTADDPS